MYIVKTNSAHIRAISLKDAIDHAEVQGQKATICEENSNAVLYEWSPDRGLQQFLVD